MKYFTLVSCFLFSLNTFAQPDIIRWPVTIGIDAPASFSHIAPYYFNLQSFACLPVQSVSDTGIRSHLMPGPVYDTATAPGSWFDFGQPVPRIYHNGGGLVHGFSHYEGIPRKTLNVSHLRNAKGEDIFIYLKIVQENTRTNRLNPVLARPMLENRRYGSGLGMCDTIKIKLVTANLPGGTYLFNWMDGKDSLDKALGTLWAETEIYDAMARRYRATRDSIYNLWLTTLDVQYQLGKPMMSEILANEKAADEAYAVKKEAICKAIEQCGYGWEGYNASTFIVYPKALQAHKLGNKAIVPEKVMEYAYNKTRKPGSEIAAILRAIE